MAGKRDLGTLRAYLELQAAGFTKGLNEAQKSLRSTSREFKKTGDEMGKTLALPLASVSVAAVKFATDFNKSMSNVATLIPGNAKHVDDLKKSVQDLSIASGKSTEDLAGGLYQVISAFGDSAESADILEIATKSASAGMAETTDAVNLLSAVTKGYGDTSKEATQKVSDLAILTVRLGQTTFPELAASIGRVVPLANNLKVSQEELFAVMATATGVTGGAAEVSTQFRGILQSLLAPTEDMSKLYKKLGVSSGEALLQQKGLIGTIQTITEAARKSGQPLQKFLSSIEGQTLAMALAGPQADVFKQKLGELQKSAGATDTAYKEVTSGVNKFGFELEQAKRLGIVAMQDLGDAIISIVGDDIISAFKGAAQTLRDFAGGLNSISPQFKTFLGTIGEIVIIGPAVYKAFQYLSLGIALLVDVNPWILALATFAAVWRSWGDEITSITKNTVEKVSGWLDSLEKKIQATTRSVLERLPFIGEEVQKAYKSWDAAVNDSNEAYQSYLNTMKNGDPIFHAVKGAVVDSTNIFATSMKELGSVYLRVLPVVLNTNKKLAGNDPTSTESVSKKAASALKDLQKRVTEAGNAFKSAEIDKALEKALAGGDGRSALKWAEAFRENTKEGLIAGYKEAGGIINEESRKNIDELADYEFKKKKEEIYDKLDEYERQQLADRVSFWQGQMEDAISGTRFNWEEQFKKGGVEIASNFLAGFTGLTETLQDSFKHAGEYAKKIFQRLFTDPSYGLGAGLQDFLASAGPAIAAELAPQVFLESIKGAGNVLKGGDLTFEQQTALALPTFGASYLYNPIKNDLGSALFGDGDAQSKARDQVAGFLEQLTGADVKEKETDFKDGWANTFTDVAGDGAGAFEAIGVAATGLAGVSEDVGPQIGYILAENLSGNLDNARLLVQELGFDTQSLTEYFDKMGLSGVKSWAEIEKYQSQVAVLTGKGLVDVGNLRGAYDQLLDSGGKGQRALDALKNIAIEAGEKGADSLEQLKAAMVSSGQFTAEEIDALSKAIQDHGITSMKQLEEASVRTLGSIVAELDGLGAKWTDFGDGITGAADEISSLEEKLRGIDGSQIDVTVKVHYETDGTPPVTPSESGNAFLNGEIQKFARGGILNSPTLFGYGGGKLGIGGEAGSEALLPLKRNSDGDLSVNALGIGSGGMTFAPTYVVNAPGASPGMETMIVEGMKKVHKAAVQDAVKVFRDMQSRGAA